MKKCSLTEFSNPSIKMRKFLLKHAGHFSNEVVDIFKFNFSCRHVKASFSEAHKPPKNSIKTVLNIEDFGHVFFFIEPQAADILLYKHLNTPSPTRKSKRNSSDTTLTQTHLRLFQKLTMAITNTLTADASHYAVEHTDHQPSDIGTTITFSFDDQQIDITFMLDDRYVKKLRDMMESNETFDREEILNNLRYQPVELGCVMLHGQCTLHELSKLQPGDFMPMTLCKNLTVKVNGHPTFFGKLQSINSELGVEIDG
ncbi:FliM/FliN family flagellar motor switch protein [Vibrio mediterranei]|uniref:FliM/FliN family flagellar motor switch protein n=1 Tax=Vibrio mediterranei TaxID=689 RepID=UPI00148DCDB7|nr:FliM/FliN family flagellar motor switch protein [Vibrio mediterranei]NOH30356.1 hypothetical protein [Vibrio mediterranei]